MKKTITKLMSKNKLKKRKNTKNNIESKNKINIVIDNSRKTVSKQKNKKNNEPRYYTPNVYPNQIPIINLNKHNDDQINKNDIKQHIDQTTNARYDEIKADYNNLNNQLNVFNNRISNLPNDILTNIPTYDDKFNDLHDKYNEILNNKKQNLINDAPINNLNTHDFEPTDKLSKFKKKFINDHFTFIENNEGEPPIIKPNIEQITETIPKSYFESIYKSGQNIYKNKKFNKSLDEYKELYKELHDVEPSETIINKIKNKKNKVGTDNNTGLLQADINRIKRKITKEQENKQQNKELDLMTQEDINIIDIKKKKKKKKSNKNNNIVV